MFQELGRRKLVGWQLAGFLTLLKTVCSLLIWTYQMQLHNFINLAILYIHFNEILAKRNLMYISDCLFYSVYMCWVQQHRHHSILKRSESNFEELVLTFTLPCEAGPFIFPQCCVLQDGWCVNFGWFSCLSPISWDCGDYFMCEILHRECSLGSRDLN